MLVEVKVFLPSQKCFQLLCRRESSCLQGRVVATGRWLCLPPNTTLQYPPLLKSMVCYHKFGMVQRFMVAVPVCLPPHNSMLFSSTLWYPSLLYGILSLGMVSYHQFGMVQQWSMVAVLPPPHNPMVSSTSYGMLPSVWYGTVSGLWWPLLGTNNPYNRSSGPPCRLLYFCTHHSIICHSESY